MDQESRNPLRIIVTIEMSPGQNRVNPADCFIDVAQTTSQRPAMSKTIQGMALSSLRTDTVSQD
ncbi:hypothetical protein SSA02_12510 [Swaminathania salitolerans]|uniref:Uncharacterized protein n=1 Tax=Swaminathania salitolerans TaxID=182838 RepID=A0A511BVN1_9PROT|nr:hypothetical protein SSA02_12510 [Swaminathania salitolerans]